MTRIEKTARACPAAIRKMLRIACAFLICTVLAANTAPLATAANDGRAISESLAGQFLIAEPRMKDPNFNETVIFMLEHDAGGALGLVINRPVGQIPLSRLLAVTGTQEEADDHKEMPASETDDVAVYSGGPVEQRRAFVLHSDDVLLPESQTVANGVAVSGDPEILRLIAEGRGPEEFLLIVGYSGWGPGQLEGEMDVGAWDTAPFDRDLIFDIPSAEKWQRARAARSFEL